MVKVHIQSKVYDHKRIIENLNFSVSPSEIVAIVGPSGAGKTTLLNIIAGLDSDFIGSVDFGQQKGAKPKLTYMFQEARLLPWMTVIDNVCIGVGRDEMYRNRAELLLNKAGLASQMHAYPKELSGGMKRRASLVRAMLPKPKVVLMDEPFVSLDSPSVSTLRSLFLDLWDECGTTTIYVTHDLSEAISIADRVLFLSTAPTEVIHEELISDKRPTDINTDSIRELKHSLLVEHPRLLQGLMNCE